ncbi:MAG: SDR family oxidoreductase [Dehalococcoidales bacterium]|nr:SDR family oxidoreductase [Dehalococcoidales bacterium]
MGLPSLPLKDRVAIVTGAGGVNGIGRAIALTLADAGADVAVCDVVVKEKNWDLEGTAEAIRKLGRRSLAVKVDVTEEGEVVAFIDKIKQEFGKIDIMVNSVGAAAHSTLDELTLELWEKGINVNLNSAYICCRAVSKVMRAQKKGVIVNMSSLSGLDAAGASIYGIAKQGVCTLTKWLAWELAPDKIRVNAIAPAGVHSDFPAHNIGFSFAKARRQTGDTSQWGVTEPSDIANVALFLVSDASSRITGQSIIVDGGYSLALTWT